MVENVNFVMEHWDPKVYNPEVSITDAIVVNINTAADPLLGIFTPEQCEELNELRYRLLDFQRH